MPKESVYVCFIALWSPHSYFKGHCLQIETKLCLQQVYIVCRYVGKARLLLWYLSAIDNGHLRVIWGGTPHMCLPLPAPAATGKLSL